ncbi:MAG TPA: ABC transporter permease [bacterium]|nr:ABC transporter permease [bacterium]
MNKIFNVARWEFLSRVRSKSFIISTLLLPVIMIGFIILPNLLITRGGQSQKIIAIVDETGHLGEKVKSHLSEKFTLKDGRPEYQTMVFQSGKPQRLRSQAKSLLDSAVISAYIVLPENILDNNQAEYYTRNLGDFRGKHVISSAITTIISKQRMLAANLNPDRIQKLTQDVKMLTYESSGGQAQEAGSEIMAYLTPIIFTMMLFFAVFRSSQVLFRSVLEERSNKLVEILLSTLSPNQLMTGKILGLGLVGLTQLAFYLTIGVLVSSYQGMDLLNSSQVLLFFLYFLTGYLLYAAIFATIGSIFDSEQEAQQYVAVLSLVTVLPIILSSYVITNPDATIVKILSYIPVITPFFMILRIGIQVPSTLEIISTLVLMVGFVMLAMWAAGKIFRVAILMYGKKPKFDEIMRWLKQ